MTFKHQHGTLQIKYLTKNAFCVCICCKKLYLLLSLISDSVYTLNDS